MSDGPAADPVLGIDVGGSGIKGALVEVATGNLASERIRIPTPEPPLPGPVSDVIAELVGRLATPAVQTIGVTFPGVVRRGVIETAANLGEAWVGVDGEALISEATGLPVHLVNDADAAALAEAEHGAAKGVGGVVLVLTVGTGIGSGLLNDGKLVPNTELGHLLMGGVEAEKYASDATRHGEDLSWQSWAGRFSEYLAYVESLFWPTLVIVGGGVAKKSQKFADHLHAKTPVVMAALANQAGIVGAAMYASRNGETSGHEQPLTDPG